MFHYLANLLSTGFATALLSLGLSLPGTNATSSLNLNSATSTSSMSEVLADLHSEITDLRTESEKLKLKNNIGTNLKFKQTNEGVKTLQNILINLDLLPKNTEISNIYGKLTRNAIKNFQIKNSLKPTGNADSETLGKLIEAYVNKENLKNKYFKEEFSLSKKADVVDSSLNDFVTPIQNDVACNPDNYVDMPADPTMDVAPSVSSSYVTPTILNSIPSATTSKTTTTTSTKIIAPVVSTTTKVTIPNTTTKTSSTSPTIIKTTSTVSTTTSQISH